MCVGKRKTMKRKQSLKIRIKEHFKDNYFMIDKINLSKKMQCNPSYLLKILKELRKENIIVRVRTNKKYYYKLK